MPKNKSVLAIFLFLILFIFIITLKLIYTAQQKSHEGSVNPTAIINLCEQKLDHILVPGTWEYFGIEGPVWKFELRPDYTFQYYSRDKNIISQGIWEYFATAKELIIKPASNMAYWDENFFNSEVVNNQQLFSRDFIINSREISVKLKINEFTDEDCLNVYKSLNFLGWNLVKNT